MSCAHKAGPGCRFFCRRSRARRCFRDRRGKGPALGVCTFFFWRDVAAEDRHSLRMQGEHDREGRRSGRTCLCPGSASHSVDRRISSVRSMCVAAVLVFALGNLHISRAKKVMRASHELRQCPSPRPLCARTGHTNPRVVSNLSLCAGAGHKGQVAE